MKKGGLPPILWEQVQLPWTARDGLALNLCNVGPILARNAITMVHDAQVYTTPQSYSMPFRLWYRFVQPMLGRRHRLILTVSEYSKSQLVFHGIAPADKIAVIHNGVDHVLAHDRDTGILGAFGLTSGRYAVGLASLQPHKNTEVLLKAFAQPTLSNIQLALFGGVDLGAFEARFGPLPANVMLVGRVSDAQLRALLEGALCYLCPSTTEGFGLPVMEAMILGCPAIAAPCGALPEVCGDAALYAAPDDPAAWATAVAGLDANPDKKAALGTAGQRHARQFSWANAAKKLLSTLSTLNREGTLQ